jgi:hypothetical protein
MRAHESNPRRCADEFVPLVLIEEPLPVAGSKTPPPVGGVSGLREDPDQARDTATPLTSAM